MIAKVIGLCTFIGFLSFKPSEPYLSQYLICNRLTAEALCGEYSKDQQGCLAAARDFTGACSWTGGNATSAMCMPRPCSSYPIEATSADPYRCSDVGYCTKDKSGSCTRLACYKDFTEATVNNQIYPYSTFFYLPALLLLCPLAELYSYRVAILVGILGRVVTRFLLLFGTSLGAMQLMQVTFAIGTAAEDIFYAYVFYAVSKEHFQVAMSSSRSAALVSSLVASVLGDLLVVEGGTPLTTLQWISAACVCCGALLGVLIIQPSAKTQQYLEMQFPSIAAMVVAEQSPVRGNDIIPSPLSGPDQPPHKDDSTASLTTVSPSEGPTPADVRAQKFRTFVSQILFFYETVRASPNLSVQVAFWIVCNATFAELFGYEVAIFQQLNGGNNKWNGLVLSVMLLLGAVGAVLPVFLKVDAPGRFSPLQVNRFICLAAALGSLFLLLFVHIWKIAASLAMLSLYLLCWQFVSVIILVQVATELKVGHEGAERRAEEAEAERSVEAGLQDATPRASPDDVKLVAENGSSSTSSTSGRGSGSRVLSVAGVGGVPQGGPAVPLASPSYAIAVVAMVALSALLQSIQVVATFSALQLRLQQALMLPVYLFVVASVAFAVYVLYREVQASKAAL